MKVPAKPTSSPARTDKFPPPLMRFLKSNAGSKSSGRSRSSPMFVKKESSTIETQEPSSPKVTCMGQVRIRKSSKQDEAESRRKCHWMRTAFFCHHFSAKIKRKGRAKDFKIEEDSTKAGGKTENLEQDEEEDEVEEGYVPFVYSPPKDALILTRSRSTPYRSSSLASRFYGSPLVTENRRQNQKTEVENTEIQKPEARGDSVSDQVLKPPFPLEEKIRETIGKPEKTEKLITVKEEKEEKKAEEKGSSRPLILTRSKSEPSRIAEKLNP